jgi:DeoR/GlpR family transcriptional regulator of sugar metabolism
MEQEIYQNERYKAILTILNRLKKVSVQDLTQRFGVSEVTIRKDLNPCRRAEAY